MTNIIAIKLRRHAVTLQDATTIMLLHSAADCIDDLQRALEDTTLTDNNQICSRLAEMNKTLLQLRQNYVAVYAELLVHTV